MHHFDLQGGVLHAEDVSLERIAEEFGTPVYVYSSATLARHFQVFEGAFAPEKPLIAFAVKANSNIAVLACLARQGAGADTVSAGEIMRALAAGVPPTRIILSGVGKTAEELRFAIDAGLHQINVESIAEFDLLEKIAAEMKARPAIALRINPNIEGGGHSKIRTGRSDDKFGVSLAEARALYARAAASPHVSIEGLAVHIGSQIRDLAPLEQAFATLRDLALEVRAAGLPLRRLDLGGGLAIPYFNEAEPPPPSAYAALVARSFAGLDVEWAFEPGRLISGNAGILLSRVLRVQRRPDRPIVVVDAAMNDLIRPAMYDAYHDIRPVRPQSGVALAPCDVVGPVCESGDTFAKSRPLPPLEAGDLVAFLTAGAYGAVMSSAYNTRALAPEVLVHGASAALIRRRFTPQEQIALETIPDWLK